jgi:DNA-binding transcriptional LysR family regulator
MCHRTSDYCQESNQGRPREPQAIIPEVEVIPAHGNTSLIIACRSLASADRHTNRQACGAIGRGAAARSDRGRSPIAVGGSSVAYCAPVRAIETAPIVINFCYSWPLGEAMRAQLDLPSLRQLRAFQAVVRRMSIGRAAKELGLSQPAVTQMIAQLEVVLAARLLERRRSGSFPTPLGSVLLPRVERLFAHVQSALRDPLVGASLAGRETTRSVEHKITDTHIRALTAIAECGSFEAAARRLGISQPALHRSARDLERLLRRSLYQRMARGLAPTSQARELARRLKVALRELEYGVEEIRAAQGNFISRIAIGNIPHSGTDLLSQAITRFLASYPTASVHVVDGPYEALLEALRAGDLDLLFGVLRRPSWAADVREEFLFSNPYAVVVGRQHPLARTRRITLRDLAGYDWILPARGAPRREAFERMFAGQAHCPTVSIETTSPGIYRSILATTNMVALLSTVDAQHGERLTILPFQSAALPRNDGVASRADWQPTRLHARFLELLRKQARQYDDPRAVPVDRDRASATQAR